jgi:AcrR family transcriptional regulator
MSPNERMTQEERREQIVEAAVQEFAVGGLNGTPVEAIAKRVGVSQPYIFQLFGTKKALFIEALRRGNERVLGGLRRAVAAETGEDATPDEVLWVIRRTYHQLLADRTLLLMQMQGYAACDDLEVRAAVREEFVHLIRLVSTASGASSDVVRECIAMGMLKNVAAAMDLGEVKEDWARLCLGEEMPA